jgi:hypothetical protein
MKKNFGIPLVIYSLLLAGLGYLAYRLAPTFARTAFLAGLTGGLLCFIWGLRALTGNRCKALPLLTLIPVSFVLLSQTVIGWMGGGGEPTPGRPVALAMITLLLVLSLGLLAWIAYAEESGGGPISDPRLAEGTKPQPNASAIRANEDPCSALGTGPRRETKAHATR